jgi:hypothetical protein
MVGLMSRQTWQNSGISDIRSGQTSWNFVSDRTRVCLTRWFFCKNQYFIKTDWIKDISNEWPLDLISFHFVLFSKIYFMFENFVITLICQNQFKARIPLPWLALFIVFLYDIYLLVLLQNWKTLKTFYPSKQQAMVDLFAMMG